VKYRRENYDQRQADASKKLTDSDEDEQGLRRRGRPRRIAVAPGS
jgi:hypothetical protein